MHWAYRPLAVEGGDLGRSQGGFSDAIERHLALGWEREGLAPAAEADRATLCRRLHVVLTGLPPTPEELAAFLSDPSPDPVATWADRLLASPRFGERWGRHWLDVVRYADSVTLRGFVFREAWRYRDLVMESFNRDMPFGQFVREQVAGDLPGVAGTGTLEDRRRGLVATTFWMLGDSNLEEQDKRQLELDRIDEQLDVLGKALLGQTLACARCHDHKFDPVPTRDYYALAGILSGMRQLHHANVSEWTHAPLPGTPEEEARWAAAEGEVRRIEARIAALGKDAAPAVAKELKADLARAKAAAHRPMAMAPTESGGTNLPVLRRGNWRTPGPVVPRGVLAAAFPSPCPPIREGESGRRELAEWLVHPSNPLVARAWVNRAWHWVFGRGLVASVDNLGTTGDAPSHPALLDELAAGFLRDGGSTKALVRRLVTSRAFRLSSDPADARVRASAARDPGNRWLARWKPRRIEAEALRDAMLLASGTLDASRRPGAPFPEGLAADFGHEPTEPVRSVYLPVFRNARVQGLAVFDAADPCRPTGAREESTVAAQALYLLNDPFVAAQARALAGRVSGEADAVGALWRLALGRGPGEGERRAAALHGAAAGDRGAAMVELAQALLGSLDFQTLK